MQKTATSRPCTHMTPPWPTSGGGQGLGSGRLCRKLLFIQMAILVKHESQYWLQWLAHCSLHRGAGFEAGRLRDARHETLRQVPRAWALGEKWPTRDRQTPALRCSIASSKGNGPYASQPRSWPNNHREHCRRSLRLRVGLRLAPSSNDCCGARCTGTWA